MTVYACVLAALMVVGAYVRVPIGPVPIVLANFFVLLAGLLLGSRWGVVSVGIYLFLGLIGLPVFTNGGGIAALTGPTGGYLFGYLVAAFLTGLISEARPSSAFLDVAALIVGSIAIYALGVPWLKVALGMSWAKALAAGVLPFLIGDALKVAASFGVVRILQATAAEFFPSLASRGTQSQV